MRRKNKAQRHTKTTRGPSAARRDTASGASDKSVALTDQAERFYEVFTELVRAYQFRDRENVVCRGLSVSQCYALDILEREGPKSMGRLAGALILDGSTMTRVMDTLVKQGFATRVQDERDRRVCRVDISSKGKLLHSRIKADLVREYEAILREVPAGSREAVIASISRVLSAFQNRDRSRDFGCVKTIASERSTARTRRRRALL